MPVGWVWLPATALFSLPVADTRSALSSVTLRWDDQFRVDATLGADFPLVEAQLGAHRLDFGIEASGAMGFQPAGELTFQLETFDGTFGFPVAVRHGPWSVRAELAHTSAHFADGVRDDGALPASSDGYSREWFRLLGSREIGPARVYAGGRALIHDQRGAEPLGVQAGAEVFGPWKLAPFAAVDLQIAAESDWAPAVSGQVGGALNLRGARRLRIAMAGRYGPEDTGKLTGAHEAWLGVTFGFDSTGWIGPNSGAQDP